MEKQNIFKTSNGSVRVYTRHTVHCNNAIEDHSCRCPKWLYVYVAATKGKTRRSLNTPSWAEAQRLAHEVLHGLDPEVALARQANYQHRDQKMTVHEACDLWINRTANKFGEDAAVTASYRTLKWFLTRWTDRIGIIHVQDIKPLQLQQWQQSADWKSLASTTRVQRWGVLRSFFAYLVRMEVLQKSPAINIDRERPAKGEDTHVQGPYTDAQVNAILANVEKSIPWNLPHHQRATFAQRVRLFIRLLEATGCDVSDAIQFEPAKLETVKVGKKQVHVYRYRRQKTRVPAVIPISADLAKDLRNAPLEPGAKKTMPFRVPSILLKLDQKKWSNRVKSVMKGAGVTHVVLPDGTKRAANTKQFRHTAAVRWLKSGQRPEEVARMLGHIDTEMVRRIYAPWCPELDEAHIRRVVGHWR